MWKRLLLPLAALALIAAGNPASESVHVVTEGETLKGIANRAGVPLVVIAEANGLAEPYVIRIGQKLAIPRQRSHTVKPGETALGIALKYDITLDQMAGANGLNESRDLRIGQRLVIPAVFSAPPAPDTPRDPAFRRPHDGAVLYGWHRRADGRGHEGLDFAIATGDMIRAAASGSVLYAGAEHKRFGQLVVLDHGNGWYSVYGHLSAITVKTGDPIKAGERLGLGGQSGKANRPELHFEIRRQGKPVDPAPLLGLAKGD